MKYCQKCGKQLLDEAVICPGCGCAVGNSPQQMNNTDYGQQQMNNGVYDQQQMNNGVYGQQQMNNGVYGQQQVNNGIYGQQQMNNGVYGQQQMNNFGYGVPMIPQSAKTSRIFGILALLFLYPLGIPAIVYANKSKKETNGVLCGPAKAGFVCGVIALCLWGVGILLLFA